MNLINHISTSAHYHISTLTLMLGVCVCVPACAQEAPAAPEKINIIFETDMGNDTDDALALDMLYKYMDAGRVNLLAIMTNKNSPYSAEYIDIMGTWYGHPHVPIGIVYNGVDSEPDGINKERLHNYVRLTCEMTVDGQPAFARTLTGYDALPDAVLLYRKILAQQPDRSVHIVSVGFSTNIAKLLDTPPDDYSPLTGKELVAAKVKQLSMMAGNFDGSQQQEYNVVKDIPAAKKVFAEWPAPVVASPLEVGGNIIYPGESIKNDFNWGTLHPMVEGYKFYRPVADPFDNTATFDLTSVLYVTEPDSAFFNTSPKGTISVISPGEYTAFAPHEDGNTVYLTVTDEQKERIRNYFIRLITKKPQRIMSYEL
jgi:inosine-uridine nucleoside N-ribohydrolase